jgi:hypothetical protein
MIHTIEVSFFDQQSLQVEPLEDDLLSEEKVSLK